MEFQRIGQDQDIVALPWNGIIRQNTSCLACQAIFMPFSINTNTNCKNIHNMHLTNIKNCNME
eukprot:8635875-Ditylum_brightwellii.AAC.1